MLVEQEHEREELLAGLVSKMEARGSDMAGNVGS